MRRPSRAVASVQDGQPALRVASRTEKEAPMVWTGRILSGLAVAFLIFDAVGKLLRVAPVLEGTVKMGYPEGAVVPIGVMLIVGVALYLIPQTSVVGAIY